MRNISQQFAAWATSFKSRGLSDPFLLARLKLAASYTAGTLIILLVFNVLVFGLFVVDLPDHLETPAAERAEEQLEAVLYSADAVIVVLVAVFSYFMAGAALKPLEASYERQKKFTADAAHELRTPLAVMKTGAEAVLGRDSTKDEYKKLLGDSLEEIDYLSDLATDLLWLVRGESASVLTMTKVDLGALARKQANVMQAYAASKKVSLAADASGRFEVIGNAGYLKRLLANLVRNAVDYNKAGGTVRVSVRSEGKRVVLTVTDTGIGMPQEDVPKIFDRFYKVDAARTKTSGGAGLGLSIVKEIVDAHNGRLSVESATGHGTTITVALPEAR